MERYRAAIRAYSTATAALEGALGAHFEEAYQRAERARQAFEATRAELREHMKEHGC